MHRGLVAAAGIVTVALLAAPVVAVNASNSSGGGAAEAAGPGGDPSAGGDQSPVILTVADRQLLAFDSCSALLDWYVAKALPQVGPYGLDWGGGVRLQAADTMVAPQPASASRTGDPVGTSGTGTNVQEDGVDEPDFAKTDGTRIVRIEGRRLVVTDVSGAAPRQLSSTELPKGVYADQLLLVGDRVLVFGAEYGDGGGRVVPMWGGRPGTALLRYDIADPGAPKLADRVSYDGYLVEARQYGDTIRLVLSGGTPRIDFVHPTKHRTPAQATRINKARVRDSRIADWLPSVRHDGTTRPLLGCSEVRHPSTDAGLGTLTVVTFGASDPSESTAVALTTDSMLAYSSADHLYVVTNDWSRPVAIEDTVAGVPGSSTTRVYAFDLDGADTTYAGSGSVPGWIADRWSMDEHDGYLRVASHVDGARGGSNRITVLGPAAGGVLPEVGSVGDLGPREQLQSVRWFDDLAVLVTFRQVDPLYTVDLTDPAHPRTLGQLKLPGFSSYLHPIGGDQLLGIGTSATGRGRVTGAQIASFDVADLSKPAELDKVELGRGTYLTASNDPHAFVYVPGHRTMLTSMYDGHGRSVIVQVQVGADGTLTEQARYGARYDVRMLPVNGDRVALVGHHVRLVDLP